ncbi:MAG: hypothetical protein WA709_12715 [Stellaceae bacterium]
MTATQSISISNGPVHSGTEKKIRERRKSCRLRLFVEELRVMGGFAADDGVGIAATGIVKGNTVSGINGGPGSGIGISATGIVAGNYASGNRIFGIAVGQGSTVVGNTVTQSEDFGISVDCPSNVTNNTAVNSVFRNLVLNGTGCNATNNVAP